MQINADFFFRIYVSLTKIFIELTVTMTSLLRSLQLFWEYFSTLLQWQKKYEMVFGNAL